MDTIIQPVVRPSKRGSYQRHTDEFKRAVVAQSLQPNASVSRIAREHNINANQVFGWRKRFSGGELVPAPTHCTLLPVTLATLASSTPVPVEREPAPASVIALTVGNVQLWLEGAIDTTVLALVLQRLLP